jgi:hypothetical protein
MVDVVIRQIFARCYRMEMGVGEGEGCARV